MFFRLHGDKFFQTVMVTIKLHYFLKASPQDMLPILWCQLMMSEVDVDGMEVEVEFSHQCSITLNFFCHTTDISRGAVWQNGAWHGSVCEAKVCHWIATCRKNLHPLILIKTYWTFYGDQTVDVSTVRWWVVCFSSDGSDDVSPLLLRNLW